ncbi:hypothetical protein ACFE04_017572 [Oxalis oulophora]
MATGDGRRGREYVVVNWLLGRGSGERNDDGGLVEADPPVIADLSLGGGAAPTPPAIVRKELDDLRDKLQPLQMKYRKEKERIEEIRKLKQKREELLIALQEAERRYDLARAADLRYGGIQDVEAAIAKLEANTSENIMLTETVGEDQIAEVVSRWTGIPVTRLGQNDKERLIGLGERLHKRVVGQDQAVNAIAEAVLRSRAGLGRPQQPTGSFLFLGPTGVVTDAALDYILAESYDPVYGARPIRRWLEKKVVTELSKMLIREEIDENSTVYIDSNGDELAYRVEKNGGLVNEMGQKSEGFVVSLNGLRKRLTMYRKTRIELTFCITLMFGNEEPGALN